MRTTIDLPDELLDIARSLARGRRQTLSEAVADLMRRGLNPPEPARISRSASGFPVISVGGPMITSADVAVWEDEDDERVGPLLSSEIESHA